MTQKKQPAARPKPQPVADGLPPLAECESWERAGNLARASLAYIVADPDESAANRIKAAELILDRALGKVGDPADTAGTSAMTLERWLEIMASKGESSRL